MASSGRITQARSRLVYDSRGDETIEVELNSGREYAIVSAPAGKSRGRGEVQPYPGNSVEEAVKVFNRLLSERLVGVDPFDQVGLDQMLKEVDGTGRFEKIGGNTAYAASLALAALSARLQEIPLYERLSRLSGVGPKIPLPLGNVLGGGSHAGPGTPDIQEMLVFPAEVKHPLQGLSSNIKVHRRLGMILTAELQDFTGGRGDEGAFAPRLPSREGLRMVKQAAEIVSEKTGVEVRIGVDVASSSLYDERTSSYTYRREGMALSREQQIRYIRDLHEEFGIRYVEDPLHENDMEGFAELRDLCPRMMVCGDDLLVTDAARIREAARHGAVDAVIIKPNQVGTLSDAVEAVRECEKRGFLRVVSHRSGETCDGLLAHVAVGLGANLIKSGVVGGERIAKTNELLRIWEQSGGRIELASLPR